MSYPGGKNGAGVYQQIINLMPPHTRYIESLLYSGSMINNILGNTLEPSFTVVVFHHIQSNAINTNTINIHISIVLRCLNKRNRLDSIFLILSSISLCLSLNSPNNTNINRCVLKAFSSKSIFWNFLMVSNMYVSVSALRSSRSTFMMLSTKLHITSCSSKDFLSILGNNPLTVSFAKITSLSNSILQKCKSSYYTKEACANSHAGIQTPKSKKVPRDALLILRLFCCLGNPSVIYQVVMVDAGRGLTFLPRLNSLASTTPKIQTLLVVITLKQKEPTMEANSPTCHAAHIHNIIEEHISIRLDQLLGMILLINRSVLSPSQSRSINALVYELLEDVKTHVERIQTGESSCVANGA